MAYDPFARGPFPAGVRTLDLTDAARGGRLLPTEVWYPADDAHAGQDVDERTCDGYELLPGLPPLAQEAVRDAARRAGRYPLVVFSHGYGGHRRQSTFLCTHLASRGYVVVAPDHTGNTVMDVAQALMIQMSGGELPDVMSQIAEFVALRPPDAVFAMDQALAGELGAAIDPERIGIAGHSFGGWTALTTTSREPRVRATVALAPAGGTTPLGPSAIQDGIELAWGRDVPTLMVVAERDTILPLPGMHEIFEQAVATRTMVVLRNADHMHFCDRVEETHEMFRMMPQDRVFEPIRAQIPPIGELVPGAPALAAIRGLAAAHMDAHLRGDEAAAEFLAGDIAAALEGQGIGSDVLRAPAHARA